MAVSIVGMLAAIALYYTFKLKGLRGKQELQSRDNAREQEKRRRQINTSIRVLAGAVGREELSLTEASIRIATLLDSLNLDEAVITEYAGFYKLREATAHIPILDAWQVLSAKEKFAFNKERERHEAAYSDFVLDAAQRIQQVSF